MRHKANENSFGARLVGCGCGEWVGCALQIKGLWGGRWGRRRSRPGSSNFVNGAAAARPHHPWIKRALLWSLSWLSAVCSDAVTWSNNLYISSPCALLFLLTKSSCGGNRERENKRDKSEEATHTLGRVH